MLRAVSFRGMGVSPMHDRSHCASQTRGRDAHATKAIRFVRRSLDPLWRHLASGIDKSVLGTMNFLRGKFLVFDGNEGCGKSTQARLLRQELESAGVPVLAVHDPGATRMGEKIRKILLDPENVDMSMRCEMLLYMASRAQMMME